MNNNNNNNNEDETDFPIDHIESVNRLDSVENIQKVFYDKSFNIPFDGVQIDSEEATASTSNQSSDEDYEINVKQDGIEKNIVGNFGDEIERELDKINLGDRNKQEINFLDNVIEKAIEKAVEGELEEAVAIPIPNEYMFKAECNVEEPLNKCIAVEIHPVKIFENGKITEQIDVNPEIARVMYTHSSKIVKLNDEFNKENVELMNLNKRDLIIQEEVKQVNFMKEVNVKEENLKEENVLKEKIMLTVENVIEKDNTIKEENVIKEENLNEENMKVENAIKKESMSSFNSLNDLKKSFREDAKLEGFELNVQANDITKADDAYQHKLEDAFLSNVGDNFSSRQYFDSNQKMDTDYFDSNKIKDLFKLENKQYAKEVKCNEEKKEIKTDEFEKFCKEDKTKDDVEKDEDSAVPKKKEKVENYGRKRRDYNLQMGSLITVQRREISSRNRDPHNRRSLPLPKEKKRISPPESYGKQVSLNFTLSNTT